jgi:TonB family protein
MRLVQSWRRWGSAVALSCFFTVSIRRANAQEPRHELVAPRVVTSVEPEYPVDEPPRDGAVTVVLIVEVDATGHVSDAVVATSGGDRFDAAALVAARRLVFEPATRDGQPIRAKIPFRFEFVPPPTAPEPPPPAPIAPAPSPAVREPAQDDVVDIDVRGERAPREVSKRTLSQTEMARAPGTNGDALHAVENLPGVARGSGLSGTFIVRGSAPDDTAVYVDGVWIPSAFHFGGVTSVIPTEMLERLDFYPGNFSPEYGRAMGGIIDIGTRSPQKDRLGGLLQFDLLDARILAEAPLSPSTRVLVGGRRSWVDTWLGPILRNNGAAVSTAPVYYDYQAMIEHDMSDRTTGRLFFFGSDDRFAITDPSPDASDPIGGDIGRRQNFFRLQARLDSRVSDAVRWRSMASWGMVNDHLKFGDLFFEGRYHIVDGRSEVRVHVARGVSAAVGVDVLAGHYDVTYLIPPQPPNGEAPGPIFAGPRVELSAKGPAARSGAYALFEVAPVDALKLIPGVRVDYVSDAGQWTVDPRLVARLDVASGFPRTTIKGGVGVFHQPPQFQEVLFGSHPTSNLARHYGIGVEQEISRSVEVSVEGFYKDLRNLVVAEAALNASGTRYVNKGSGRAYGAELLLKWKPGGPFSGFVAYTLSRSERRNAPGEPLSTFEFDQTHILNALGSYALGRGWTVGARFRYVTGNPYTPYVGGVVDFDAGAYAPIQSPSLSSARVSAFHSLDVRIDKTWNLGVVRLSAYLDVRNVYNRQNAEAVTYNYNYSQSSTVSGLPILPIVGVRGEL